MIAALAGVLALAVSGPARAAVPSGNLLGGGAGAEEGPAAANAVDVRPPGGGWVSSPGFTQVAYGAGAFPSAAVSLFVGGGTAFFAGGPDVGFSTADRDVDVSAAAPEIDAGRVRADLGALLGGYAGENDAATVRVQFLGANQGVLGLLAVGPVTATDRGGQTTLLQRAASAAVPPGTRSLFVRLSATRAGASGYDDGYADNLSLSLVAAGSLPPPGGGGGGGGGRPVIAPAPAPAPPAPETTITARPPALSPDQVVRFSFSGTVPGQLNPSSGVSFACRLDGGAFRPCVSPYTTGTLALAQHTFEVRAVSAAGVSDPTPARFAFRVTQPRAAVDRLVCAIRPVGAHHDRGTRDWGPCTFRPIVCPRGASCLLDLAVDEHDDSYLFNYDVHLQRYEQYAPGKAAYRDRLFCFAPPLTTPVNPKIEVRFDPRRGERNSHHACHQDGALGFVDTTRDVVERFRCEGSGHAPKPGGDTTTGGGREDNANLECWITATIQRNVPQLGEALSDSAQIGPSMLVVAPQRGSLTVKGAIGGRTSSAAARRRKPALATARVRARGAGALRVPLRLNAAARALRRRRSLRLTLTSTFTPATGAALTRITTLTLRRRR
jgi:hypothetical protein